MKSDVRGQRRCPPDVCEPSGIGNRTPNRPWDCMPRTNVGEVAAAQGMNVAVRAMWGGKGRRGSKGEQMGINLGPCSPQPSGGSSVQQPDDPSQSRPPRGNAS